jgi:uncharacterized phiE125 gp8 family phage protein
MSENLYNLPLQQQIAYECWARWGVKVIQPAMTEPITLQEAKLHLRIDDDAVSPATHPDDPLITVLITAAREWCEAYSGLSFAQQVVELGGRAFNPASAYRYNTTTGGAPTTTSTYSYYSQYIELPMSPISNIIAVAYTDDAGVEQTVNPAEYVLDDYVRPPRLYAASGTTWPIARADSPNVCRIRYLAGFNAPGSPDSHPIPQIVIAAIKLVLTHLYENRSAVEQAGAGGTLSHPIPLGAQALLDIAYRTRQGFA